MNNRTGQTGRSSKPIERRDRHFDLSTVDLRRWQGGSAQISQFYNAMSLFFPEGEQFFIDAVRHYRDRIEDPALLEAIRGFIGQEAMHGREHRAYNEQLASLGFDVALLEGRAVQLLDYARQHLTPIHRLAATIALEHFTAILADAVLRDPRLMEHADPVMAALWRWHAAEETEHKAVAFDVFRAVAGQSPRAYLLRSTVMMTITLRFLSQTARTEYHLLRQDAQHSSPRGWLSLTNHLFGRPGLLRQIALPWLAYFRPGFHPWQHDNRGLLNGWLEQDQALSSVAQAA